MQPKATIYMISILLLPHIEILFGFLGKIARIFIPNHYYYNHYHHVCVLISFELELELELKWKTPTGQLLPPVFFPEQNQITALLSKGGCPCFVVENNKNNHNKTLNKSWDQHRCEGKIQKALLEAFQFSKPSRRMS